MGHVVWRPAPYGRHNCIDLLPEDADEPLGTIALCTVCDRYWYIARWDGEDVNIWRRVRWYHLRHWWHLTQRFN